jgi:hypothetical protein
MNLVKLQQVESDIDQGEDFWRSHVDAFNSMNITKIEYSKHNNAGYHRFLYWHQKLSDNKLLPVKIKTTGFTDSLCTLETPKGYRVLVHDESALTKILSLL